MCIVIIVMAAVWPIGLWRRGDGGGTVKKESKKRSKQLRLTILGKTRYVLLHFDSSKLCVCPLYKFLYAFKVVKLFLKHPLLSKFGTKLLTANRLINERELHLTLNQHFRNF
jgi:hypothetical protein